MRTSTHPYLRIGSTAVDSMTCFSLLQKTLHDSASAGAACEDDLRGRAMPAGAFRFLRGAESKRCCGNSNGCPCRCRAGMGLDQLSTRE